MTDRDGRGETTGRRPGGVARRLRATGRDRARAFGVALAVLVASVVPVPASSGGEESALGGALDALPAEVGLTDPFHLVGYAVLAALLVPVARGHRFGPLLAAGAAVAFGFGIELVQAPIPWRSFAWRDAAVNAVGAVIGAGIAVAWGSGPEAASDRDDGR
ncbi:MULTISPECIES: VanZ family protein [unclassified Halorubrum]|uniref:VanZ family protein n=1 Tax=unclassified Halorubrum TaxID=2642239 RepID=UPI0010F6C888|nr:VanZ family protein [Halorubrum sp. ARQ200]TKX49942.1 VanZ family protein [Halorubrum sp. ASP121]TKX60949.1 VanZ family protein [Halorubrum sp. ASP1]